MADDNAQDALSPWIAVIVLALVIVVFLTAAALYGRYRTKQNVKHVDELRRQLFESLEKHGMPTIPDPPNTLRIDPSAMPPTIVPAAPTLAARTGGSRGGAGAATQASPPTAAANGAARGGGGGRRRR